jgi:hypothetical protein
MRMKVVILLPPRFDLFFGISKRQEPVGVETLIAERAVERLDEGVIGGSDRTGEVECHLMFASPSVKGSASELIAVIGLYPFRDAVMRDEPFSRETTCSPLMLGSAWIAKHSRVNWSMTVRALKRLPLKSTPETKSTI